MIPPTAYAAKSRPAVTEPPPMTTAPTAGKRTIGWPKVIAMMSTTKLIRTFGRRSNGPGPRGPTGGRAPWGLPSSPRRSGRICGRVHRPRNPAREEEDVHGVGPRVANPGHEHPPDAWPTVTISSIEMPMSAAALGKWSKRQEPRGDRLTRRRRDRRRDGVDRRDDVERPDRRSPRPRRSARDRGGHPPHGGRRQRHPPPVEAVRDRPAVEARRR